MANYRERLLTDSPTGPSFSTARRRDPKTSATLEKPLTRESLVALTASFDAGGQWPVCRADASPAEDPYNKGSFLPYFFVNPCLGCCQRVFRYKLV